MFGSDTFKFYHSSSVFGGECESRLTIDSSDDNGDFTKAVNKSDNGLLYKHNGSITA